MAHYRKAIVTYMDILGFRDLVTNSQTDPSKIDHILHILRTTKKRGTFSVAMAMPEGSFEQVVTTQNFSDLIVRISFVNNESDIGYRTNIELMILAGIQCRLAAHHGILLRGGVSAGELYLDDDFLFGPALVRSYELESAIAVYPRIVVDAKLVDLAKGALWPACLKRSDDGTYFIDYLRVSYKNFGGFTPTNFSNREEIIPEHKATVERKLIEFAKKPDRIKAKAMWMGLYHNSVISELAREFPDSANELGLLAVSEQNIV